MTHEEYITDSWKQLLAVLENILASKINLTEACREVVRFRGNLGQENNELFLPFVGFYSESDGFPMGDVRKLWAPDGLKEMDLEREAVENHYKKWIEEAAHKLHQFAKERL